jgi:hypothetical protein
LKFADVWQPNVDGRTFGGTGDTKLIQGFGHAFSKVADGLPCGFCAVTRAKRVLTDGGYNYMIIMRIDVTDDISPEVDEVTAEFGNGVVQYPEASRIPYEYKLVSCETGQDISSFETTTAAGLLSTAGAIDAVSSRPAQQDRQAEVVSRVGQRQRLRAVSRHHHTPAGHTVLIQRYAVVAELEATPLDREREKEQPVDTTSAGIKARGLGMGHSVQPGDEL